MQIQSLLKSINKIKQKSMNNQDSLLGFLKKKSLFNQSPTRNNGKRSRSKSRDKDSIIRKFNDLQEQSIPNNYYYTNSANQDNTQQRPLFQRQYQSSSFANRQIQQTSNTNRFKDTSQRSFNQQDFVYKQALNNLGNYVMSFESARLESTQCLQSLSFKLNTQISNVNYRLQEFRGNMMKVLTNQLKSLRQQILRLVDEAFKESQRNIREYMKMEEQKLAADLIKIKQVLEKEYVKVETMKEEINQPQWRKVTGEILATELEKNIGETIKKSSNTQIGRWEMKNLSGQRLKTLQVELRDLVRLKE